MDSVAQKCPTPIRLILNHSCASMPGLDGGFPGAGLLDASPTHSPMQHIHMSPLSGGSSEELSTGDSPVLASRASSIDSGCYGEARGDGGGGCSAGASSAGGDRDDSDSDAPSPFDVSLARCSAFAFLVVTSYGVWGCDA